MPALPDAADATDDARSAKELGADAPAGDEVEMGSGPATGGAVPQAAAETPDGNADDGTAAARGAAGVPTNAAGPDAADSGKEGEHADDASAAEADDAGASTGSRAPDPAAAPDDAPRSGAGEPGEVPPDPALLADALRIAEALLFASDRPVTPARLQSALPPDCDARAVLAALSAACAGRPVRLAEVAGGFAFRTAPELAPAITRVVEAPRRLPRAAMETLAIVAYHQPVTRAEIEDIRGASLSQSTLETLLDAALIAPRGRKEVPGRPSLWGTTPRFLEQFGLRAIGDLPRREELVNEPTLPLGAPPQPAA